MRLIVVALGVILIVGGLAAGVCASVFLPIAIEAGIFGVLLIVGTVFEGRYRTRRRGEMDRWRDTGERFTDPTTGKLVQVRYNPQTGERAYLPVE